MQGKQFSLLNKKTRVIIQGFGKQGSFHCALMQQYGTNIVAAVTRNPSKEHQNQEKHQEKQSQDNSQQTQQEKKNPSKTQELRSIISKTKNLTTTIKQIIEKDKEIKPKKIPVYKDLKECVKKHKPSWSILFVPAQHAMEAAVEALNFGLNLVIITEGMPVWDMVSIIELAKKKKLTVIGPNCPGITKVGECKLGIMPNNIFLKGNIGIVSRSGTLTYEVVDLLSKANIGQSFVIGIGGDQILGTDFVPVLEYFEKDKATKKVVLLGEIGGVMEQQAIPYIKTMKKQIIAFIAGLTAPQEKRMGHAGAIIDEGIGLASTKIKALEEVGVKIAVLPSDIVKLIKETQ